MDVQPAQLCPEDFPDHDSNVPERVSKPTIYQAPCFSAIPESVVSAPTLAFARREMDNKTGLIRIPLQYVTESGLLQFKTSAAGLLRLPYGVSEPYASRGAGAGAASRRAKTGTYSVFLEIPEDAGGELLLEFLRKVQQAILEQVVAHKAEIGLSLATRNVIEFSMHPFFKNDSFSIFQESVPGIRCKMQIGGRKGVRCTKKGVPIHQGPLTTMTANSSVEPTLSVLGVWVLNGRWGIIVHIVQVEMSE